MPCCNFILKGKGRCMGFASKRERREKHNFQHCTIKMLFIAEIWLGRRTLFLNFFIVVIDLREDRERERERERERKTERNV
jgi:hypothetical protein